MSAKKKVIEEKPAIKSKNYTEILELHKPSAKQPGRIIGTDVSAVPELVKILREEIKVI